MKVNRLTTKTSIMGRKHDLAYGYASIWKEKLSKHYRYDLIEESFDKLGQLEDLEEELGIDLITLFKALKQGYIYVKHYYRWSGTTKIFKQFIIGFQYTQDEKYVLWSYCSGKEQLVDLKDYKTTWWLKEDLQDE